MKLQLLIFIFAILFLIPLTAGDISCDIVAEGTCGDDVVLRMENDTGGFDNAHAELENYTGGNYNYEVCCSSTGQSIETQCSSQASEFLTLSGESDAHVQDPYQSWSTEYDYSACLVGELGTSHCVVTDSGAPTEESYECIASIASSEGDDFTNAHVASCGYYNVESYCFVNTPPTHDNPDLTSGSELNTSEDDLFLEPQNPQDADGHDVDFAVDWRVNGDSIAVLNMPFLHDYERANEEVRDYSLNGNNGTLGNSPEYVDDCIIGGCYEFDGSSDYIETNFYPGVSYLGDSFTWSFWNKWDSFASDTGSHGSGDEPRFYVQLTDSSGTFRTAIGDEFWDSMTIPSTNEWYFITIVYDDGTVYTYLNGSLQDTEENVDFSGESSEDFSLGRGFGDGRYLDGATDMHMIFDRALSEDQIQNLYQDGLEGNSSMTMSSEETETGESWSAMATPGDGWDDGLSRSSNTINIQDAIPDTPDPLYPVDEDITDREPTFDWTDESGSIEGGVTYDLEVESPEGLGCFGFNESELGNDEFESPLELCTDIDYSDDEYEWRVRSCGDQGCSGWSEYGAFNVSSVNQINLTQSDVNFGVLERNESADTTDDNPNPLVVRNQGNIRINLESYATEDLFEEESLGSDSFQFQAREIDSNAFNASESQMSFVNVDSSSNPEELIKTLLYFDGQRDAGIDILVNLPSDEPSGEKSTEVFINGIPDSPS